MEIVDRQEPIKDYLKLKEQAQYLPFVYEYADIVQELGLLDVYSGSKRQAKYVLMSNIHKGSGFLFSVQPLPLYFHQRE